MKRVSLLLLSLLFLVLGQAKAENVLNIKTNPFMAFTGNVVLDVDFRVADTWSLGFVSEFHTFEPLYEIGLRASHYDQGTFQTGWTTGIEALYKKKSPSFEDAYYDDDGSYCIWDEGALEDICGYKPPSAVALAFDYGYLWRWKTFNASVGIGAELSTEIDAVENVVLLSFVQFSIGWVR